MAISKELVGRILAGLGAGGAFGYYAMPHVSGYGDVESARRLSGTMNATTGAILGALSHNPTLAKEMWRDLKPAQKLLLPASVIGSSELVPSALAAMQRSSGALKDVAKNTETSSVPFNVQRVLSSPSMHGAGAGVGLAGLGALVSGLSRRQTEEEALKRKNRGSMVGSDFLRYALPAAVAGGVLGSFKQPQPQPQQ